MDMSWTGNLGYIPHVALGSLALGAGGRLARNLVDLSRGGDKRLRAPAMERATASIPIEVTPEEAEELRRKGLKVRKVLKTAQYDPSILHSIGYGALGAGAGMGGWALADKFLDSMRKRQAEKRRDRVRQRIERLLSGEPDDQDLQIADQMKVAEEQLLSGQDPADLLKEAGVKDWLSLGGMALGAGGLVSLLSGYRKGRESSKARAKAQALRRLLRERPVAPPAAAVDPYVVDRAKPVEALVPAVQEIRPIEVVEPAGSPAQQAEEQEEREEQPVISGSWI